MIVKMYIEKALYAAFSYTLLYIIVRFIYIKKKNKSFCLKKEILNIIIFTYFAGLFSQTIVPIIVTGFYNGKLYFSMYKYNSLSFNFIPFKSIKMYMGFEGNEIIENGKDMRLLNMFSNIGLFIPFGILIPIKFGELKFKKFVLCAASCSVFIEIVQILVERAVDIDDVILNTLGAIIGFVFLRIFVNAFFTKRSYIKK